MSLKQNKTKNKQEQQQQQNHPGHYSFRDLPFSLRSILPAHLPRWFVFKEGDKANALPIAAQGCMPCLPPVGESWDEDVYLCHTATTTPIGTHMHTSIGRHRYACASPYLQGVKVFCSEEGLA